MAVFRPRAAAYSKPRALVAAAAQLRLNDRATVEALQNRRTLGAWQEEAWEYYDAIGEIKYAFNLVAAVVSRIRLFPAVVVDPDAPPVLVKDAVTIEREPVPTMALSMERGLDPRLAEDAVQIMEGFTRTANVPRILSAATLNLEVAGECYLANIPEEGSGWRIYSTHELMVGAGNQISLRLSSSNTAGNLATTGIPINPETALIGRIWRPHPRYSNDADSSMKALRSDCDELLLLDKMVRSAVRSRMNAGILFVPDALSVAARTPTDLVDPTDPESEDVFENELMTALTQPIADEQDASAVVPLLIRGPADLGERIRHTMLGRDVSQTLTERSRHVLERILQGLDVPKEVVQGLADVKYSNALVITDGMYRATIEPMAVLLSDAITEIILRPMLHAKGWSEATAGRVVTWYDPSEVVTRPDPAESASAGYDRFLLSGDAWRQAHGFSDADAPRNTEVARRVALEKTAVTPEVAQVLLEKLFPEILKTERDANVAEGGGLPDALTQKLDPEAAAQSTAMSVEDAPDLDPLEQLPPAAEGAGGAQ